MCVLYTFERIFCFYNYRTSPIQMAHNKIQMDQFFWYSGKVGQKFISNMNTTD
jgi:hypothetical protein